jgi:hypothetical protein
MELKPNSVEGFTHTFEAEVIPLLRKQKGFKDEITFIPVGQKEAVAISLWDSGESHRGNPSGSELRGLQFDMAQHPRSASSLR